MKDKRKIFEEDIVLKYAKSEKEIVREYKRKKNEIESRRNKKLEEIQKRYKKGSFFQKKYWDFTHFLEKEKKLINIVHDSLFINSSEKFEKKIKENRKKRNREIREKLNEIKKSEIIVSEEKTPEYKRIFEMIEKIENLEIYPSKKLVDSLREIEVLGDFRELFKSENVEKLKEKFLKKELKESENLLNDINGKSLDKNQRIAVITEEDNNLVVAGAGSGKTLTIAGKVKYLKERLGVEPEDVLLITFTKKAAQEMEERINKKLGIPVMVKTFHSLGYSIIREFKKEKVDLFLEMEEFIYRFKNRIIWENEELQRDIFRYFTNYYNDNIEGKTDFKTVKERLGEINLKKNIKIIEKKMEKIQVYLDEIYGTNGAIKCDETIENTVEFLRKDLEIEKNKVVKRFLEDLISELIGFRKEIQFAKDRRDFKEKLVHQKWINFRVEKFLCKAKLREVEKVKNIGDLRLANYLFINEIEYRYKGKFYLKEGEIFKFAKGEEELFERVREILLEFDGDREYERIFKLLENFLVLFKASNFKLKDLERFSASAKARENSYMREKHLLFFKIFKIFYMEYQKELISTGKIDFNDMINLGTKYIRENLLPKKFGWKYIIIDEFQDISIARYRLLVEIKKKNNSKIMAVGDDWQSIYRFAGSEISIFTKFEEYFGKTEVLKIEKTYRNSQSLVDIAGKFVMKNPGQIKKKLSSKKFLKNPVVLVEYREGVDIDENFSSIARRILEILEIYKGKNREILLLGRNFKDIEEIVKSRYFKLYIKDGEIIIKCSLYKELKIRFLTVHKSKGIEADEVIILNNRDAVDGFPNKMENDSVMDYVIKSGDEYPFAEERRLFYVGLTRSKNHCYLLYPKRYSVFIEELLKEPKVEKFE